MPSDSPYKKHSYNEPNKKPTFLNVLNGMEKARKQTGGNFSVGQLVGASLTLTQGTGIPTGVYLGIVVGYRSRPTSEGVCVLPFAPYPFRVLEASEGDWEGSSPPNIQAFGEIRRFHESFLCGVNAIVDPIPRLDLGICFSTSTSESVPRVGGLECTSYHDGRLKGAQFVCYTNSGGKIIYDYAHDLCESGARLCIISEDCLHPFPEFSLKESRGEEGNSLPAFSEGDIALIVDTSCTGGMAGNSRFLEGVPVRCLTPFQGHPRASGNIEILGGRLIKKSLAVLRSSLAPVPEPWFMPGDKVEVVEQVDFRKHQLLGQKGKIVMYPDRDGDAGVEFNSYLEAGSLDGAGKDGHCLFVPAKALKKV